MFTEEILQSTITQMNSIEKEIGTVISFVDGCITATGLYNASLGEKVIINDETYGVVFDILEDKIFIFTISTDPVEIGSKIKLTKEQYSILVSENMQGHIIDILGNCIDGTNINIGNGEKIFIEKEIPGMTTRKPINKPLETGFLTIDTLIPIGRGQRQLFIGNQNTGKTYTAISSFIRQKNDPNVICIYVGISQQKAKIARLIEFLKQENSLEKTIIVSADAFEPALNHYLAPYVGTAIAEYFCHKLHKDVIIVYDDLSNHAIAYRELCLLMKRAPSREAYPGDVFYLHARLLERSGNFLAGGSITALPIAQLQEDDFSAYIPTNLVSITDGQIIFDTKLFNKGIKPAINTELSVSRVGSAAQYKSIHSLSKSLRLELAQYNELSLFSQFSSDLDQNTLEKLKRGKLLTTLLKQEISINYTVSQKYIILYIFKFFYQEITKITNLTIFFAWSFDFFESTKSNLYDLLESGNSLSHEEEKIFSEFIREIFILYQNM